MTDEQTLVQAYTAFNNRDLETLLSLMHPEVEWPNGWEGGVLHGREELRDYWTRQWAAINPLIDVQSYGLAEDGRVLAKVRLTLQDPAGQLLLDEAQEHLYVFKGGLVSTMEVRK